MSNLEESINVLNLDPRIKDKLKENQIKNIKDLWNKKRKDLKTINLSDKDITEISIQLQLIGIDLNKKIYKET